MGTNKKQYFMPSWPTLFPGLIDGKSNERIDTRVIRLVVNCIALRHDIRRLSGEGHAVSGEMFKDYST